MGLLFTAHAWRCVCVCVCVGGGNVISQGWGGVGWSGVGGPQPKSAYIVKLHSGILHPPPGRSTFDLFKIGHRNYSCAR